jgi:TP901 family phage tail tape measure protein
MAVVLNVISTFNDKGLKSATNELDKFSKATTQKLGSTTKAVGAVGFGILAGAAAVGVGLYQIGSSFDEAFDMIRTGTGATGPMLDQLKTDMKAVASAVPASFTDAGTAITMFNQKLGLTGQPLQLLSEQALELSRITGTELAGNIQSITDVMQNFGVSAADQSGKLDLLFRASQASGVSVADLSAQMSDAGVVLRTVGLDFDQSAAFLATLGKAGVDVADVMPSLNKALATAAKNGKDATTVFNDTFNAIKNAPNEVEAAGIAYDVFGAKAGPKFAALIREGKLSYDDMLTSLRGGSDTIVGAGKDTQDFGEKLTVLKNRVFVALEPVATKAFDAIGRAMDRIGPIVENLTNWMMKHQGVVKIVAGVLGGVMLIALAMYTAGMIAAASATIAAGAPFIIIGLAIAALVAAAIYLWVNWDKVWTWISKHKAIAAIILMLGGPIILPIIALVAVGKWLWANWKTIWAGIQAAVAVVWPIMLAIWNGIVSFVQNILIPIFKVLWAIAVAVFNGIATAVMFAWNSIIKPIWDAIYAFIVDVLVPIFQFIAQVVGFVWSEIAEAINRVWENIIQPVWNAILGFITDYLVPYFQLLWTIAQTVFSAIGDVISWVWNNLISPAFEAIKTGIETVWGFFQTAKDIISTVFSNIADAISGPFKTAFNFISDAWNNTVGKLKWDVPDWIPFIGGKTISVPQLPHFADGGMFNTTMGGGAGLAVLHDNEMVLNPQQQKALFSGNSIGGASSVYNINVSVSPTADKASIGQSIVESIAAYERRAGDGWRAA